MAQFSLSWESHKTNICNGLSTLQQNGEFVDMTLAADGHLVKVHRMVMSLVSPYIKELLASADCQHPVIFLNKVSFKTLCAILEYVYTGEVVVDKDDLTQLIEAANELCIQGLEDMKVEIPPDGQVSQSIKAQHNEGQPLSERGYFKKGTEQITTDNDDTELEYLEEIKEGVIYDSEHMTKLDDTDHLSYDDHTMETDNSFFDNKVMEQSDSNVKRLDTQLQYTISNQGALQLILNRYIYYLNYTSRKECNGRRSWKCVHNAKGKNQCPATVVTRDDVVIKRYGAHSHPFHDKRILKKVRDKAVFTALNEAEKKLAEDHSSGLTRAVLPARDTRLDTSLRHFPTFTELWRGKWHSRRRCARCAVRRVRSQVTTMCSDCEVALCLGRCWVEYHSLPELL